MPADQTLGHYFDLEILGLEHLPAQGAVIICPKHQLREDIPQLICIDSSRQLSPIRDIGGSYDKNVLSWAYIQIER